MGAVKEELLCAEGGAAMYSGCSEGKREGLLCTVDLVKERGGVQWVWLRKEGGASM